MPFLACFSRFKFWGRRQQLNRRGVHPLLPEPTGMTLSPTQPSNKSSGEGTPRKNFQQAARYNFLSLREYNPTLKKMLGVFMESEKPGESFCPIGENMTYSRWRIFLQYYVQKLAYLNVIFPLLSGGVGTFWEACESATITQNVRGWHSCQLTRRQQHSPRTQPPPKTHAERCS